MLCCSSQAICWNRTYDRVFFNKVLIGATRGVFFRQRTMHSYMAVVLIWYCNKVHISNVHQVRACSSIKPQISSATNAACISNSNVTYLVSCWPPWTVEEGDIASFFVKDLGLALAPEMCPDQSQAFKEVNHSQTFTVRRKLITTFSEREASRCSKACFYKVSCKYSKNWRRRTNIR